MSDQNNGVIVEQVGQSYGGMTSDEDRANILANALGEKKEGEQEAAVQSSQQEGQEPETEQEPKQEEDQFSSKFAALSRKEKEIRQREAELEARLKEIEDRNSKLEEEYGKYKTLPERLKNQPLDVLAEEGVDFDTLIKMVLENDGKPTTEMQIQQLKDEMQNKYMKELENLRTELEEKEKAAEEQRYNEVIEDYKYELNEFIDQNSETYELIKLNDAADLVYQVVEEHYNENGRVLSNEEACEHVENYLLDEAKKHLNVNKIKSLLNPEPAPQKPRPEQRTVANTLSNTESATVPTRDGRVLSDEESKREAAKLIRWME